MVSPLTHFLLVDTRAEADKPADMPDLVKVPSMKLPAGFGGLGSLHFCDEPCMAPLSVNEAPEHYGSLASVSGAYFDFDDAFDAPVVLRSGRRADRGDTPNKAGTYDIPAFLRRSANQDAGQPLRDDPSYWCAEPHYTGLTPLGLTQGLGRWPGGGWSGAYHRRSG